MHSTKTAVLSLFVVLQADTAQSDQSATFDAPTQAQIVTMENCYRPAPPLRSDYVGRADYLAAREDYYRAASLYISHCLEAWIGEARSRYNEMFMAEVQVYMDERQDVLDELRRAISAD